MNGDYRLDLPAIIKQAVERIAGTGRRVDGQGSIFAPAAALCRIMTEPDFSAAEPAPAAELAPANFQREFERRRAVRHAGFKL